MRKLLSISLYVIIAFISNILLGCNEPEIFSNNIPDKTYEDFYKDLENTSIEMEVVIKDKRATVLYTNDTKYYISTIKFENTLEFGFIYDIINDKLYNIENGVINLELSKDIADEKISKIFTSGGHLFYLDFDKNKFEFIEQTTIANRLCDKYRYVEDNLVYNIYLDSETSICLKCVCSKNDIIELFFETKKFINEPKVENYIKLIDTYNEKQIQNEPPINNNEDKK